MRKRNIQIITRLNRKEAEILKKKSHKCKLSQASYIRFLITGYVPREAPPLDYHNLIRELRAIGNNMNQIAAHVNAIGYVNGIAYQEEVNKLHRVILSMQEAMLLPEKHNGND